MSGNRPESEERRARAQRAIGRLGQHRSKAQRLSVQCRRAHHVAAVYATEAGPVYLSRVGPHSHGSKDYVDTGHAGTRGGEEYLDLLVVDDVVGDELPAWCDCGPRQLSRAELLSRIEQGQRALRLP